MNEHIRGLLSVIDGYLAADPIPEKTLSFRMFSDSKTIGFLRSGSDITTGRLQLALDYLSERWPKHAKWPKAVNRPKKVAA